MGCCDGVPDLWQPHCTELVAREVALMKLQLCVVCPYPWTAHTEIGSEAHKYLGVHWLCKPMLNGFCLNPPNNAANFKALLWIQKSQDNNWSIREALIRLRNLSFKRTLGSNSRCMLAPAEGTAVAAGPATCPGQGEVSPL